MSNSALLIFCCATETTENDQIVKYIIFKNKSDREEIYHHNRSIGPLLANGMLTEDCITHFGRQQRTMQLITMKNTQHTYKH